MLSIKKRELYAFQKSVVKRKKEEVPIQLVFAENKAKGTSNDYESHHEYTRTKGKW